MEGRTRYPEIRLLGAPEVRRGSALIDVAGRRRRALLVMLALAPGRAVSVDRLVDAVWGEDAPDNAATSLHSHVSRLRTVLDTGSGLSDGIAGGTGRSLIVRRGEAYALDLPPEAVDAVRFEDAVARARGASPAEAVDLLTEALALWDGPALGEFAGDEFARAAAVRLEESRLGAMETVAESLLALGRAAEAIPQLEAAVRDHPLRERFTGLLMTALYGVGRGAEATRAYERLRSTLADELGLNPSPELAKLELAMLNQTLDVAVPASPVAPPPVATPPGSAPAGASPGSAPYDGHGAALRPALRLPAATATRSLAPFVGREGELGRLDSRWQAALRGEGGVSAVVGLAGLGKTRLVAEFARAVHDSGGLVLWGRCTPEVLTRYQPFVEALEPLVATAAPGEPSDQTAVGPVLSLLFPGRDGPDPRPSAREVDRYALFSAVTNLVRRHAAVAPVLLVVDDAQWADSSTTAMAIHLARNCVDAPVMIVATYRTHELTGTHPAADALAELQRDRLVDVIALGGLDPVSVEALVRHLRPASSASDRRSIVERCEGNPFFAEELVADLDPSPGNAGSGGGGGAGVTALPRSIRAVLDRRIGRLGDEAVRRLRAAAVIGREFDLDVLAELTSAPQLDLLDDVEAALDANLLVEVRGGAGRFAFAHSLVRDVLADGMSDVRRQHLRRAAGHVIAQRDATGARAAEIAGHLVAAGFPEDRPEAARQLLIAATTARAVFAHDEAIALAAEALALDGDASTENRTLDPLLRCDLCILAAQVLRTVGQIARADELFDEASELARDAGDAERFATAVTGAAFGSGLGIHGDYGTFDERRVLLIEEALTMLGPDGATGTRIWLLSYLATVCYHDPEAERRERASAEALALAERLGDDRMLATAHIGRQLTLAARGGAVLADRLAGYRALIHHADASGDAALRVVGRLQSLPLLAESGDRQAFDVTLAEAMATMSPLGGTRAAWFAETAAVAQALLDGRFAEAAVRSQRAARSIGTQLGTTAFGTRLVHLVVIERETGQQANALTRLVDPRLEGRGLAILRGFAGLLHADLGELEAAGAAYRNEADDAFTDILRNQSRLAALVFFAELAWLTGERVGTDVLDGEISGRDEHWAPINHSVWVGPIARARGLLADLRGDAREADRLLTLGLELARRAESPPWIARIAAELALVKVRVDQPGAAEALRTEAATVADSIGQALPGRLLPG